MRVLGEAFQKSKGSFFSFHNDSCSSITEPSLRPFSCSPDPRPNRLHRAAIVRVWSGFLTESRRGSVDKEAKGARTLSDRLFGAIIPTQFTGVDGRSLRAAFSLSALTLGLHKHLVTEKQLLRNRRPPDVNSLSRSRFPRSVHSTGSVINKHACS